MGALLSMPRNGGNHSVFLDASGQVWTTGKGRNGQLGLGDCRDRLEIEHVLELPACKQVAAGSSHTVCLSVDGKLYYFGNNSLEKNNPACINSPQVVQGLPRIQSVACGGDHTVCIDEDGGVWSFGDNKRGELGVGHSDPVSSPTRVELNAEASQ